jgi:hypothetical protein
MPADGAPHAVATGARPRGIGLGGLALTARKLLWVGRCKTRERMRLSTLQTTVTHKKWLLGRLLAAPMETLAERIAGAWGAADAVDRLLAAQFSVLPYCRLLYTLDTGGTQVSSNVLPGGIQPQWRGQDLSQRPYLEGSLPYRGFILSNAYLSARSLEPCITAIQAVRRDERLLGFIAADFPIRDLPDTPAPNPEAAAGWQQFKGDPAIRGTVFLQQRSASVMDEHLDDALAIMHSLLVHHGVFHGKLHFSSTRITLWHVDDPFNYRVHAGEEVITPEVCLAYPHRPYPRRATVRAEMIRPVLDRFRALRDADEIVYLRSGSLNIINGMVGLTFSCDGSHYMSARQFLDQDMGFWLGAAAAPDG